MRVDRPQAEIWTQTKVVLEHNQCDYSMYGRERQNTIEWRKELFKSSNSESHVLDHFNLNDDTFI